MPRRVRQVCLFLSSPIYISRALPVCGACLLAPSVIIRCFLTVVHGRHFEPFPVSWLQRPAKHHRYLSISHPPGLTTRTRPEFLNRCSSSSSFCFQTSIQFRFLTARPNLAFSSVFFLFSSKFVSKRGENFSCFKIDKSWKGQSEIKRKQTRKKKNQPFFSLSLDSFDINNSLSPKQGNYKVHGGRFTTRNISNREPKQETFWLFLFPKS